MSSGLCRVQVFQRLLGASRRHCHALRRALLAAVVVTCAGWPSAARAIPLFANAQGGISCETCHNVPPNLNAYGRYILATNFGRGLDVHAQMRNNARQPFSVLVTDDEASPKPAHLPTNYSFFDAVVSGGFFGPKISYYAAVPIVENGFPASSVYQSWIAYNGFSNGNGSLRVGKFATPFLEPWLGLPAVSLTAYAPAVLAVGQNTVGLGENRWGASYTQSTNDGLVATVGWMTDQGPIESAYNTQKNLGPQFLGPPGNQGSTYVASLQYLKASSRLTGGVAYLGGQFPLVTGGKDPYSRAMALLSYDVTKQITLTGMRMFGHDNRPNGIAGGPATSNGWSVGALFNPAQWAHVELRSERTNNGLGLSLQSYVSAIAFNPIANTSITVANVMTVGGKPAFSGELAWTGPWYRHQAPPQVAASGGGGVPGAADFAAHCAACHGATGGGGVGPSLIGIGQRLSLDQRVAFIENPTPGGIMPKLYPSQLNATQVQQIATFIGSFGAAGTPAPAGASPAPGPAGGSPAPSPAASGAPPAASASGGADVFSAHCAACHGATGNGGVGPNLHGLAQRMSLAQTIAFIENPTPGGIMPKLYPSQLTEAQVQQVAAYIQTLK